MLEWEDERAPRLFGSVNYAGGSNIAKRGGSCARSRNVDIYQRSRKNNRGKGKRWTLAEDVTMACRRTGAVGTHHEPQIDPCGAGGRLPRSLWPAG